MDKTGGVVGLLVCACFFYVCSRLLVITSDLESSVYTPHYLFQDYFIYNLTGKYNILYKSYPTLWYFEIFKYSQIVANTTL